MDYTITTAKGTFTGTLEEAVRWQCDHQGAWATIIHGDASVSVDDLPFHQDEISETVSEIRDRLAAE